jgi:hypothetical protein
MNRGFSRSQHKANWREVHGSSRLERRLERRFNLDSNHPVTVILSNGLVDRSNR